jgi:hypothetical protein
LRSDPGFDGAVDGRAVGGDVVGDQLAEERPPRGFAGVVGIGTCPAERRGSVADPAGISCAHQQSGIGVQGFKIREHASVARLADRPVHRTGRVEAVVTGGHVVAVGM